MYLPGPISLSENRLRQENSFTRLKVRVARWQIDKPQQRDYCFEYNSFYLIRNMNAHSMKRVLGGLFAACTCCSTLLADSANPQLWVRTGYVSTQMKPVDPGEAYTCEQPERPVKVDIRYRLHPTRSGLTKLFQAERTTKRVTVRRGGQIGQGDKGEETGARFVARNYSIDQLVTTSSVEFLTTIFFCDYNGYPEFVGLTYKLEGEIGNLVIRHKDVLGPDVNQALSLSYNSNEYRPSQTDIDEGASEAVGVLDLTLRLKDLPFELKQGRGTVLADLRLTSYIEFSLLGATP